MAEEAELIHDTADLTLLEKRAIMGERKEKARKELMKVYVAWREVLSGMV